MLTVRHLELDLPDRPLLQDLNFQVKSGTLWHVTGANGAGKSTLLRALVGLKPPTDGSIEWDGQDIHQQLHHYWEQIHYVGHLTAIKPRLTVRENGQLNVPIPVSDDVLESALDQLQLLPLADQFAGLCSAGQQRRLALLKLLTKPALLWLLDEPFTALDQESAAIVTQLIESQVQNGGAVIMTSHRPLEFEHIQPNEIHLPS